MDVGKIAELLKATIDPQQREQAERQLDEVSSTTDRVLNMCSPPPRVF